MTAGLGVQDHVSGLSLATRGSARHRVTPGGMKASDRGDVVTSGDATEREI
jgi:hypothetical protein